MEWYRSLPTVNAVLNTMSALLVFAGYLQIRKKNIETHRRLMLSACIVSALFLVSYLTYHALAGSTRFTGTGTIRTVYFTILLTHTVLAVAVLPLVLVTVWRGLRRYDEKHRRIARWTLPVWLYVSVTGVLVYLMLYVWYPA